MRIIVVLSICLLSTVAVAEDSLSDSSLLSYPGDGKTYTFHVSGERLLKTPIWAADADNPPLPPRKAQALAVQCYKKLGLRLDDWMVESIELEDAGDALHWLYVVHFREHPSIGRALRFSVIVLMDRTVAECTVTSK